MSNRFSASQKIKKVYVFKGMILAYDMGKERVTVLKI